MQQKARVSPQPGQGRPVIVLKEQTETLGSVSGVKTALTRSTPRAPAIKQNVIVLSTSRFNDMALELPALRVVYSLSRKPRKKAQCAGQSAHCPLW